MSDRVISESEWLKSAYAQAEEWHTDRRDDMATYRVVTDGV